MRLHVGTGASARLRIGISGKCSTHMWSIVVTLEVSHNEMSWLNLVASENLPGYVSAPEHRRVPASAPAESAASYVDDMSVTFDVSHVPIGPT